MLIIYRQATGEIVQNMGTNSLFPEGVPDDMAWGSRDRTGLALLRLHDKQDAALVQSTFTHRVTVANGTLVIGDPLPTPAPTDPETPAADYVTREEFDGLMTMFLESM